MRFRSVFFSSLFACFLASTSPHAAQAELLSGYSTGAGANTSYLVIDFAFLDADAYLFEYRYDGAATSQDMLLALDAAGGLGVDHDFFDFGGGPLMFINGFSYDGNSAVPDFLATGQAWRYWLVNDVLGAPLPYYQPEIGPSGRTLEPGSVDAFGLDISEWNELGLTPTFTQPPVIHLPASACGDPDNDCDIDDSDLGTAFSNYTGPLGNLGTKTMLDGDTDGDGDIDDSDLGTLFSNYTGPISAANVPEPGSAIMLGLVGVAFMRRRN